MTIDHSDSDLSGSVSGSPAGASGSLSVSRPGVSGSASLSASGDADGITADFRNMCVTVRFVSGRTVTGFFRRIEDGLLLLTVAGSPELVSLFTVETIALAGPNAC